jgi:hypothetical protein
MYERKPPLHPFITRHEEDQAMFSCAHKEADGTFRMHKPSFGRDVELQRIAGSLAGATPTIGGEQLAEIMAVLSVGFESAPQGFNPSDIVDTRRLAQALFREVTEYWAIFRSDDEA